jgi:23S rRNA (cytidine2498-2'-O)-methyltransferase
MRRPHADLQALLLYCRPGFESECAAEIQDRAQRLKVPGYSRAKPDSGYVLFTPSEAEGMAVLFKELRFADLCFARQMVSVIPLLSGLPVDDRIGPLMAVAAGVSRKFCDVFLETADTNEAKELSVFLRKFQGPFTRALLGSALEGAKTGAPPRWRR